MAGGKKERRRLGRGGLVASLLLLLIVCLILVLLLGGFGEDPIQISGVRFTDSDGNLTLLFEVSNGQDGDFNGTFAYLIRDPRSNEIYAMGEGGLSVPSNGLEQVESRPTPALPEKWSVYSSGSGEKPIVEIFIKDEEGEPVQEIRVQVLLNP